MMQESYILVVDDESMITDTLRIELNSFLPAGLLVRTVSSGPEALALIREEISTGSVPAVAIVDYLMRPMKGSELLQEIEVLSPTTKKIMLTGHADLAAVEKVMSTVRLYRYMEKPWRPMDMELSVNEALRLFSDEQRMRAEAGLARSDTRAMGLAMADQVLATKHKDLNRSLSYARTIQECFIPDLHSEISDRIGLHVMDRPLAEVSGDFRWYRQTEDHLYLALGDCTGHGLAGALIAVIATDILSNTLGNTYSTNPEPYDAIRAVVQGLKSRMVRDSGSSEHVGLELTLVRIDLEQKRMDWSSLHGHMLAIDQHGNSEILSKSRSISSMVSNGRDGYRSGSMALSGQRIIILTDGIIDQFGGPHGKRLRIDGLLRMVERGEVFDADGACHIENAFDAWKGVNEQVDDCLWMSFGMP
jgi:serine phosphatase RsbU (regulator of sigma subunit)